MRSTTPIIFWIIVFIMDMYGHEMKFDTDAKWKSVTHLMVNELLSQQSSTSTFNTKANWIDIYRNLILGITSPQLEDLTLTSEIWKTTEPTIPDYYFGYPRLQQMLEEKNFLPTKPPCKNFIRENINSIMQQLNMSLNFPSHYSKLALACGIPLDASNGKMYKEKLRNFFHFQNPYYNVIIFLKHMLCKHKTKGNLLS